MHTDLSLTQALPQQWVCMSPLLVHTSNRQCFSSQETFGHRCLSSSELPPSSCAFHFWPNRLFALCWSPFFLFEWHIPFPTALSFVYHSPFPLISISPSSSPILNDIDLGEARGMPHLVQHLEHEGTVAFFCLYQLYSGELLVEKSNRVPRK